MVQNSNEKDKHALKVFLSPLSSGHPASPTGGHLQVLLELSLDAERRVSTHTYLDDGKVWPKQVFRLPAFGVLCYVMDLKQGLFYPLKVQETNHLKCSDIFVRVASRKVQGADNPPV